ncbi:hypothetical protein C5E46_20880 [Nocardia nova]|nr:hypothetical protein C5E46_20880 [Nocardia nova]
MATAVATALACGPDEEACSAAAGADFSAAAVRDFAGVLDFAAGADLAADFAGVFLAAVRPAVLRAAGLSAPVGFPAVDSPGDGSVFGTMLSLPTCAALRTVDIVNHFTDL